MYVKFICKIYANPHKIAGKGRRSGTPESRNTGIPTEEMNLDKIAEKGRRSGTPESRNTEIPTEENSLPLSKAEVNCFLHVQITRLSRKNYKYLL